MGPGAPRGIPGADDGYLGDVTKPVSDPFDLVTVL